MEDLLTPKSSYDDKFDEQVFKEVPWSSNAHLECNQEVELLKLEGSKDSKAKLRTLIIRYQEVFSMTF